MSLRKWRAEFLVPGPGPYALSHSVGCLPRAAANAAEAGYFGPWRDLGGDAWPEWLQRIEDFRATLATLLGGHAQDYCPQANLSSGLVKLLAALPQSAPNRRILLASEHCFPSMAFVLAHAPGYQLRFIPAIESPGSVATWRRALDAEDVCGALITHVHSNTGVVAPVADVTALCRARNITSIVDIAQSAGIMPINIPAFDADVVLGSCVKWLCGGPGAGFMWIHPVLITSLRPADVGWFSHAHPFEGDPGHFEYAADARRFWGGTPVIVPYVIATCAMRLLAGIGIEAARTHNLQLQHALWQAIAPRWSCDSPPPASGGTVCLALGNRHAAVEHALRERQVRYDRRNDILRLSFHIYNSEDDVGMVAAALNSAA